MAIGQVVVLDDWLMNKVKAIMNMKFVSRDG